MLKPNCISFTEQLINDNLALVQKINTQEALIELLMSRLNNKIKDRKE